MKFNTKCCQKISNTDIKEQIFLKRIFHIQLFCIYSYFEMAVLLTYIHAKLHEMLFCCSSIYMLM